jgi:hypothetical protein
MLLQIYALYSSKLISPGEEHHYQEIVFEDFQQLFYIHHTEIVLKLKMDNMYLIHVHKQQGIIQINAFSLSTI